MENSESKNEYERIRKMNHQLYIMKKNKKAIRSKWRQSREMLEEAAVGKITDSRSLLTIPHLPS